MSSASRATIGGMIANNSSGARSVVYGKTIDHVRDLHVVLADARVAHLRPRTGADLGRRPRGDRHRGRRLSNDSVAGPGARERDRPSLPEDPAARRRLQPRRLRRSGPAGRSRPASSSGPRARWASSIEATVGLVPLPRAKALLTVGVRRAAGRARRDADGAGARPRRGGGDGRLHPAAHARQRRRSTRSAGPSSSAMARRCCASSSTPITSTICRRGSRRSSAICRRAACRCRTRALTDAAAQARVWSLREAALGLSMAMKGDGKAVSFVEDTAVAPEHLRAYIARFLRDRSNAIKRPPASTRTPRSAACTCGRSST